MDDSDEYWSVDIPGLTEDQARELVRLAEAHNLGQAHLLVDPSHALTLRMGPETVGRIAQAWKVAEEAIGGDYLRSNFRLDLEDWLSRHDT